MGIRFDGRFFRFDGNFDESIAVLKKKQKKFLLEIGNNKSASGQRPK